MTSLLIMPTTIKDVIKKDADNYIIPFSLSFPLLSAVALSPPEQRFLGSDLTRRAPEGQLACADRTQACVLCVLMEYRCCKVKREYQVAGGVPYVLCAVTRLLTAVPVLEGI